MRRLFVFSLIAKGDLLANDVRSCHCLQVFEMHFARRHGAHMNHNSRLRFALFSVWSGAGTQGTRLENSLILVLRPDGQAVISETGRVYKLELSMFPDALKMPVSPYFRTDIRPWLAPSPINFPVGSPLACNSIWLGVLHGPA